MLLMTTFGHATSPDLAQTKLMGRWPATLNPSHFGMGEAVALSDKWALVGSFGADDVGGITDDGAVQVFSAVTGAWVRLLRPPSAATNDSFGTAVAINGDLGIVSSPGYDGNRGAVFVFNLVTGALVRTLFASDAVIDDRLGRSLAVSSGKLLVGASSANSLQGSAYLFDLVTGVQLQKFKGSDSAAGDYFGLSVAMDGNIAAIGSIGRNAFRGAVYLFDLTTYAQMSIIVPTASAAGDSVGESVALSEGVLVMGAGRRASNTGALFTRDLRTNVEHTLLASDGAAGDFFGLFTISANAGLILAGTPYRDSGAGAAYLFDLHSGIELRKITAVDAGTNKEFGSAISLYGNTALIGSRGDSSALHTAVGSGYIIKPLMTFMPVTKVAARADSAPSIPETAFSVLNDAFINGDGETAFTAKLTGAGSHANTDVGNWSSLQSSGALGLTAVTNSFSGLAGQLQALGTPIINQPSFELYPATLKVGVGGVTAATSNALFLSNQTTTLYFTSGVPLQAVGLAKVATFIEPVQTLSTSNNRVGVTCALKLEGSITASTDSAFFVYDFGNNTSDGRREGAQVQPSNTFMSITYGQFTGRISYLRNSVTYSAAIAGPIASNAVLMQKAYNVTETVVAQKSSLAPGAGIAAYSAFIGETTSPNEDVLFRASLSGSPVATNEGLWSAAVGFSPKLMLRKGTPSSLLPPGLTIAKFVNYWSIGQFSSLTLALVQLAGPGVSAANDQALILLQENGSSNLIMREGQAAPGCHPATIGVINRIDVDPWLGTYAIVATLVGAPVGTELALFTGVASSAGNATTLSAIRRPTLYLRKGHLYHNQPSKIRSFSLPSTNLTVSGAGGTGRGRSISWSSRFVVTVEFDNGVRQIMKGTL